MTVPPTAIILSYTCLQRRCTVGCTVSCAEIALLPQSYTLQWPDPASGLPGGTTCFGCHQHRCTQATAPPGCNTDSELRCDPVVDPSVCAVRRGIARRRVLRGAAADSDSLPRRIAGIAARGTAPRGLPDRLHRVLPLPGTKPE